jgi:transcriptional regulator with XRE-family HTH domain
MRYKISIHVDSNKGKRKMKLKLSDDKKQEIGYAIRTWMLKTSSIAQFCRENKLSNSTVDSWIYGNRGPSLESAMKIEKLSKGELTKEFLCPQYNW